MSRTGDLVKIQDEKTGSSAMIKITDNTKIIFSSPKSKVSFHRPTIWT